MNFTRFNDDNKTYKNYSTDDELWPIDVVNSSISLPNFYNNVLYAVSNSSGLVQTTTFSNGVLIAVACGLLLVFCVLGNSLVVLSFLNEPALRVITNYWIVSLSFTDIVLALAVMPLQMIKELNDGRWTFGALACDTFICMDVLCCTCSIYHLCLISADRYFCVRFPIAYPQLRTKRATVGAIAVTWTVCALISLPRLFGWKDSQPDDYACVMNNKVYMVFSSVLSFYAPLFLICCTYAAIYRATHARTKRFTRARLPISAIGGQQRLLIRCGTVDADELTVIGQPVNDANTVTTVRSSDESSTGDLAGGGGGSSTPKKDRSILFGRSNALARRFAQSMSLQALLAHSLTFDSFYAAANNSNNNNNNNELSAKESGANRFRPFFRMPSASDFNRRNLINRAKLDRRRQKQEHRAAKVVVIVLAAFVLLWAPFFLVNIIGPLCGAACDISDDVWKVVTWLGYCNSAVNPAIYTFFNRTFRRAILDVCRKCWKVCFTCDFST